MAITTNANSITIGGYTFCQAPTGIDFSGCLCGQVFCDTRTFGGTVSGYSSGGLLPGLYDTIDKFPFTSDTSATDVGELTQGRYGVAGHSSATHGYTSGGFYSPSPPLACRIDKFTFASDANATIVGNLVEKRCGVAGQSSKIQGSGYTSGGFAGPGSETEKDTIEKFPFITDTNATDIAELCCARNSVTGQSSDTHGYTSGGFIAPVPPQSATNFVGKFPFAAGGSSSEVGFLSQARRSSAGQSSTTSGYNAGGYCVPINNTGTTIDKFPFSSDTNATDVGELFDGRRELAGQQV